MDAMNGRWSLLSGLGTSFLLAGNALAVNPSVQLAAGPGRSRIPLPFWRQATRRSSRCWIGLEQAQRVREQKIPNIRSRGAISTLEQGDLLFRIAAHYSGKERDD